MSVKRRSVRRGRGRTPAGATQREGPAREEFEAIALLFTQGRYGEVESRGRSMTERHPHHGPGWKALGAALNMQGRLGEALACARRAVELMPDDAEAQRNLAEALRTQGRLVEAEAHARRALELGPNDAKAHAGLGNILNDLNRLAEAEASLREALRLDPSLAEVHNVQGVILYQQGRLAEAQACFSRALVLKPDLASAYSNLGVTFYDLAQFAEAEVCYRRALTIDAQYAEAHSNLGNVLRTLGRLVEAEASCRRALEISPDHAKALSTLGNVLQTLGRTAEAEACYRRALQIRSDYVAAYDNLLMTQQYVEGHSQAESFAEHVAFADRFEAPLKAAWPAHRNAREPDRRLKVGYVSPDLRRHPVAYFAEPLLAHHDREQVEVHCYYSRASADETTARLRGFVEHWRDIAALSDEQAAQLVTADGIDILVDLSGHTSGNRLLLFARKPAPVQATWLGYACTTGLAAIDYRISDALADPIGASEPFYTETLYRLDPSYLCYQPPGNCPAVGELPARTHGAVTFGSFNNLMKLSPGTRALWARLLAEVPGSRLMLKRAGLGEEGMRQLLIDDFARHGVAQERLILVPGNATHYDHMAQHNSVDIGLDVFPYNGATTTLEALWMGVPVVSLAGDSFISRQGVSLLTNTGMPELIAYSRDDYVDRAARLACDLDGLAGLRAGLRERLARSPLLDARRFAREMEHAYRKMWQAWLSGSKANGTE